ncbi:hypothetical protein J3Q64DRAFT_1759678 [Phycomyces blakesleeanus]|uniref:EamA domain-containing protein n=2 Tax=Phycomyces blakesleeanus TaxID=4837 RepID=A0A167KDR8_PHYB8|nr:hypothetical protein PHYBLDRAFT_68223 [Phycomyces blakesleeanus NRRL 1555(-)]OAD67856.1 hypothetical protein PHYBLDRAFT_68223 [Phycomyces blakesleeanus NRRL 1555(-)]|eukprot:XP_018285896.1 hypothetical protein PHYBLDRAFT_68223 [Phycomyces blakesleeanus NRRL 1555(-)]
MVDLLSNSVFTSVLLVTGGCTIALQAGCNGTLNRYIGRSASSVWSFTTGVLGCLVFFAIDVTRLGTPLPSESLRGAPGYAWIGGILGAYYVITNILTVRRLGAATTLSIFVCSLVIMACIIDNWGLLGVEVRKYSIARIFASLGLVLFVAIITRF